MLVLPIFCTKSHFMKYFTFAPVSISYTYIVSYVLLRMYVAEEVTRAYPQRIVLLAGMSVCYCYFYHYCHYYCYTIYFSQQHFRL